MQPLAMKTDSATTRMSADRSACVALLVPAWYDFVVALIPCPECEKQVSTVADACPNCGYPVARKLAERGESTGSASTQPTTAPPETKASAVVTEPAKPAAQYANWPPTIEPVTSTGSPTGSIVEGPRDPSVASQFEARSRRNRRFALVGFLGLAVVVLWFLNGRDWWKAREEKRDAAEKEKAQREFARQHGYYCFVEQAAIGSEFAPVRSESSCWQGQDECSSRRVERLRDAAGATITECAYRSSVIVVKFACKQDPAKVCYVAHESSDECERERQDLLRDFNNVSACHPESR
jgi:hypothetical protein